MVTNPEIEKYIAQGGASGYAVGPYLFPTVTYYIDQLYAVYEYPVWGDIDWTAQVLIDKAEAAISWKLGRDKSAVRVSNREPVIEFEVNTLRTWKWKSMGVGAGQVNYLSFEDHAFLSIKYKVYAFKDVKAEHRDMLASVAVTDNAQHLKLIDGYPNRFPELMPLEYPFVRHTEGSSKRTN